MRYCMRKSKIKEHFKDLKISRISFETSKFELDASNRTKKRPSNVLLSVSLNCREDYLKERGLRISLYLNPEFDYDKQELDKQFQKIAKLMKEEQEKLFFGVIEFVLQYNDGQFKIENISYH